MITWLVEGFPSIQTSNGVCVGCLVGKHPEKKYDVGNAHRAAYILDLIHSDVAGPIPIKSINGYRYFLTFIDDCSRYCWIYFMKLKLEFFETLKSFKDLVENSFNKKIKSIKSDGGGEYVKRDFHNFYESEGIRMEHSVPYTPQQNGVVESKNKLIWQHAFSMDASTSFSLG